MQNRRKEKVNKHESNKDVYQKRNPVELHRKEIGKYQVKEVIFILINPSE